MMYIWAKLKTYKACSLYQLRCVTQYLYASGDFLASYWTVSAKKKKKKQKHFLEGLSEVDGLSVFPRVKCGIKKTTTDILAGDRIHVEALVYVSKAADPFTLLKLGL